MLCDSLYFSVIDCGGSNLNMRNERFTYADLVGIMSLEGEIYPWCADIFQRLLFLSVHNCKLFDHRIAIIQVCRERYSGYEDMIIYPLLPMFGPPEICKIFVFVLLKLIKVSRMATWQKNSVLFPSCKIHANWIQRLFVCGLREWMWKIRHLGFRNDWTDIIWLVTVKPWIKGL